MRRRILYTVLVMLVVAGTFGAQAAAAPAAPRTAIEVSFPSADGIRIAGTLTLPPGAGPHAAVLLIAGSGPQDRDGSIAGHRPLRVLADHLTRQGFAVLRTDRRGVGASTGSINAATTLDFAADAAAAIAFLAAHPRIDRSRVGIIGHSEGGMIAPIVANRSDDVAFLVLLAAPGLPMSTVAVQQTAATLRAEGVPERTIAAQTKMMAAIMDLFAEDVDTPQLVARARPILHAGLATMPLSRAARSRHVDALLTLYATPWPRFTFRYDPTPELRRVRVPVLALNGSRDVQVDATENLAAIAAALEDGANDHAVTLALPGLNHLFQTARTGALSEYGAIDEAFAPLALNTISDWITSVTNPRTARLRDLRSETSGLEKRDFGT